MAILEAIASVIVVTVVGIVGLLGVVWWLMHGKDGMR